MAIKRKAVRSIVVLYPKGRFVGGEETDELEKAIMNVAGSGNTRLILNMREVTITTSAFITVLVKSRANYENRQGEIKICSPFDTLGRGLHFSSFLFCNFDNYNTEEEAIAAFVETATQR